MPRQNGYHVAILGATGAVGEQMLKMLDLVKFPISQLTLLSSARSSGKQVEFQGNTYTVQEAKPESFEGVDIALFSAGGSISKQFAKEATDRGAIVIDNTSAFRMDPDVPLVVPEVNADDLHNHNGIIANPNCSTIQMVVALEPLRQQLGLQRVVVSTYQAVSGAGQAAIDELTTQSTQMLNGEEPVANVLPVKGADKHHPIAFNALPQIDVFQENGFTFEEMKMINETKKILHLPLLPVAATCVRLPIVTGHSESVTVHLSQAATREQVKAILEEGPGITVQDQPEEQVYPTPLASVGHPDVFVGRIRQDMDDPQVFHMWVVSDNLLKGAAYNSVQIAQELIKRELV